ncbi:MULTISPECIES: hypothetical protein [Mycobacteriaceae]|uniref:Uncharacterized protein n=1 Tax=Mycolicibacterium fallax TaxID=1793 RepID=A0A1X1R944_MYCFA|nr:MULTISPECIES: hypothetical protein [Mycobacteriaceae]ORV01672.1 hypothetical protein AWC04_12745 [Mycolicibacterium fallax]BBY98206.1 hypothetical protein MFAL_16730 [Mycolicibacterium fallax]
MGRAIIVLDSLIEPIRTDPRGRNSLLPPLASPDSRDEFDLRPLVLGIKLPREQCGGEAVELVV